MNFRQFLALLIFFAGLFKIEAAQDVAPLYEENDDGVTVTTKVGALELRVFSPWVVEVVHLSEDSLPQPHSLAVIAQTMPTHWKVSKKGDEVLLRTSQIVAHVNTVTGSVSFYDTSGQPVLQEKADGGSSFTRTVINGLNTLRSRQQFILAPDEGLYGLGQHQNGLMNYRGSTIHLQQQNPTESAVPVLVSSRGYGILWDNPAITDVSVGAGEQQVIPADQFYTDSGQPGGLTARYYQGDNFDKPVLTNVDAQVDFDWTETPPPGLPHDHYSVRWTGFVKVEATGDYTFVATADDGVRLWVDDQQVINDWNARPAKTFTAKVHLTASALHRIRVEYFQYTGPAIMRLAWQLPATAPLVTWTSEAANVIDYYFMYGPALDQVVADYRDLTGAAPLLGKWAWGFWQCKEHYATQQELLDVEQRYRQMQVPFDNIIQDWYYWSPHPWGSHEFDLNRYPDFLGLMQQLHADHTHLIISVWGRFDQGSANWQELENVNALYPEVYDNFLVPAKFQYYDAFNPLARRIYWQQISRELFADGVDGWWLDASEPELGGNWGQFRNVTTAAGPGFDVFNAFPLMHTTGVYQGQRAEMPDKRVFILTRSAYAGQQRNSAVTWSGDIQGTWDTLAEQIPAGLNFSISGIPYWNTDTGGFFGGDPADPKYAELFTRWFQFSAFCPLFRVHGTGHPKEMWRFDTNTENILIQYDQLRYHLIPYIYSVSWAVTHYGDTMMRPLVMDFQQDTNVFNISDQYLFGPAVMACPVTKAGATTRPVYLPAGTSWTDFWTGKSYLGGQTVVADAPIETMPLFVRAGSIIPYAPPHQYAMQSDDPLELRVYRGASGEFTLYDDEGDNYDYEAGKYSTIPVTWDEAKQTLVIGKRQGIFPGMLEQRKFHIVWVSPGHGSGIASTETPDVVVNYTGKKVKIRR